MLDARAQEAPDLVPLSGDGAPDEGQSCSHVESPQSPRRGVARDAKLHHADAGAGLDHSGQLAHRRLPVVHVPQQVGERERVELLVAEGQTLRLALNEAYPLGQLGMPRQAIARSAKHVLALVEADDLAVAPPDELGGYQARTRGDVEDALSRSRGNRFHQRTSPARILTEAEQCSHLVVAGGQAREQLKRMALALGAWALGGCGHQTLQAYPRESSPRAYPVGAQIHGAGRDPVGPARHHVLFMPLKLVLGPANSAKAGEVLGGCAAAARRGAVLVVPTRRDVERYSRELAERGAVLGCTVVTFAGLMREIARRAGYRPATLTRLQRERVLRRALGQTRFDVIDRSARSNGFASAAWGLISELQRALVPPERFSDVLRSWAARDPRRRRYAQDLAALYDAYAGELHRLGRVDGDLYAWRSVDALAAAPTAWGAAAPVFVYGFDDLTPAERYALETLSGPAGAQVVVSLTWEPGRAALVARANAVQALRDRAAEVVELPALADYYEAQSGPALHHLERHLFEPEPPERVNPGAAIRLLEAGGERAEAELVAAELLALLRAGVPASEIVVVHRSLRRVGPLVERVFAASGIPVALHRDVPFTHTALGRGVVSLVKCALLDEGRASAADLLSYLRTPGVPDQPRPPTKWRRPCVGLVSVPPPRRWQRAVCGCPNSRRCATRATRCRSSRAGASTVLEPPSRTGSGLRPPRGSRRASALGAAALARGAQELREPLGGEELVDVLEHLAVPVEYAPIGDAVLVAEPLEIRARRFRVVFVCGLQESEFPRSGHPDPLLGDELRRELAAIAPSNGDGAPLHLQPHEDALEQERYLFYASVTRATEQVVLSYRSSDEEGGIELPSPFIADVADLLDPGWMARRRRRLLADVVWAPQEAPTVHELARSRAREAAGRAPGPSGARNGMRSYTLGQDALRHVRHRRVVSAGALESYAQCPMKWLVERELQLEPLAPETDSMVRGQVVHRVLEELYRRLGAAVTEGTLARAQTAAAELLREYAKPVGAAQPAAIRAGLVRAIQADVDRLLALEASSGTDWSPSGLELRFGFEDEASDVDSLPALELPGGVRVRGVIDRVDVEPPTGEGAETVRRAIVRDYKTGATRPAYQGARWAVDQQLQVPLYMLAVRELLSFDPVAGFYQPVGGDDLRPRGVFVEEAPVGNDVLRTDARSSEDVHAELEAAAGRAVELAAGLREGRLEPRPDTCSRGGCAFPGICRAG